MEGRIEHRNMGGVGEQVRRRLYAQQVGRVVQRGQRDSGANGL